MKRVGIIIVLVGLAVGVFWYIGNAKPNDGSRQPQRASVRKGDTMGKKQYDQMPEVTIDTTKKYTAIIQTNKGDLTVQLSASDTPRTVNNFVFLAREGFYQNTAFHRIIKGFMIQGGDPNGDGTGGPGYTFEDEPIEKSYDRGVIAMANRGPDTNGSQFFIMHAEYALPKNYVIFGQIEPGDQTSLATLDAIAATPVGVSSSGEQSRPLEQVIVKDIQIKEE